MIVLVKEEIMISRDNNLVRVWLTVYPVNSCLDFCQTARLRQVAGMNQDVAVRKARLAVVCV